MITCFDDAFTQICDIEGNYSDNPEDPGGATMYGITQRVAQAHGYTGDMQNLPLALAKSVAKSDYWDAYQCDQFDPRIGYLVFSIAYNGGHPAQWLQKASGVTVDGVIGAQTIAAVRSTDVLKIVIGMCSSHLLYYTSLNNETFLKGWANRVAADLNICIS